MFKTKIILQNDSTITGYVFNHCFGLNTDSLNINMLIKENYLPIYFNNSKDTIRLYSNIIRLKYPDNYGVNLITCYPENVYKISLKEIKYIEQIEKSGCHPELLNRWIYASNGLYPFVIDELTRDDIQQMANKPIISFEYHNCSCWDLSVYWIVSYNETLTLEEIESILDREFCKYKSENNSPIIDYKNCQKAYPQVKQKLKDMKIIMFMNYYIN